MQDSNKMKGMGVLCKASLKWVLNLDSFYIGVRVMQVNIVLLETGQEISTN